MSSEITPIGRAFLEGYALAREGRLTPEQSRMVADLLERLSSDPDWWDVMDEIGFVDGGYFLKDIQAWIDYWTVEGGDG